MDEILMKCGHVAQGFNAETKEPYCVICDCSEIQEEIPNLDGRIARCSYCGNTTKSQYTLPFFEHQPDKEYDKYYDGCFGWD